ncbi:hypothetical protein C0584_01595 [Candidatus Parcubacteria bacterium]|nr:MAG: hypothetical protein C0584_01595 [Candidatus Parcubacteria bacterium]
MIKIIKKFIKKVLFSNFTYKHFPFLYLFIKYSKLNVNSSEYWDNIHSQEIKNPTFRFDNLIKDIINRVDFNNKSVLDIGCGQGYFLTNIPEAKKRVGIDFSKKAIDNLIKKNIEGHVRTLPKINLWSKFDIISCFETLEHVKRWKQTIDQAISHLEENGLLLISTPFEDSIQINEHVVYFDLSRIYNFLKKRISILEIKIVGPWMIVVAQKSKQQEHEIPKYFLKK